MPNGEQRPSNCRVCEFESRSVYQQKLRTMTPLYTPGVYSTSEANLASLPWLDRVSARRECFLSEVPREYTYGSGGGERKYFSSLMPEWISAIMTSLPGEPNVCFCNKYEAERNALGWHSDDSPDTSGAHPISVVSFGEPREIWWRKIGDKGVVPAENRLLLEPGSLFVMPAGFQSLYEHRIPKGSRSMGPRVSLTFRHMLE
jgi:hypothetical protein